MSVVDRQGMSLPVIAARTGWLTELHRAGKLDWSRAVIDGSHRQARRGGPKPGRARPTVPDRARNTT